jgi:hypothetical protein
MTALLPALIACVIFLAVIVIVDRWDSEMDE